MTIIHGPGWLELTNEVGELVLEEMRDQDMYKRTCYHRFDFNKIAEVVIEYTRKLLIFPETYTRVENVRGVRVEIEEDAYGWHRMKINEWTGKWTQVK